MDMPDEQLEELIAEYNAQIATRMHGGWVGCCRTPHILSPAGILLLCITSAAVCWP